MAWQTIDTAPMWTEIDLWGEDKHGQAYRLADCMKVDKENGDVRFERHGENIAWQWESFVPTHWMLVPEGPRK